MRTKPWRLGTRAKLLWRGWRYAPLLPYASIDGWLTVDEAIALYELARELPGDAPLAIEIGSWQGKSSICLASGLRDRARARLCCIDPFDASGDEHSAGAYGQRSKTLASPLRQTFEQNLRAAGLLHLVDVRQGRSHELAATWREPIDLLFLDGDHSYEAVACDYRDWAPRVRPGGFLVLHDVVHEVHVGPRRVVDEMVRMDPNWIDGRYVDSMFIARRAPV